MPDVAVLGHELCGHAVKFEQGTHPFPGQGLKGHRHAIDTENVIRKELGLATIRAWNSDGYWRWKYPKANPKAEDGPYRPELENAADSWKSYKSN